MTNLLLTRGNALFKVDHTELSSIADVYLSLADETSLKFQVELDDATLLHDTDEFEFYFEGNKIRGFITNINIRSHAKDSIVFMSSSLPVEIHRSGSQYLSLVEFELFNLDDIWSEKFELEGGQRISKFEFGTKDVLVEIKSTPQTRDNVKNLKKNGGTLKTHCARMRHSGGGNLTPALVKDVITDLYFVLSFAKGNWVSPPYCRGYSNSSSLEWEMLADVGRRYRNAVTWFDPQSKSQLGDLFSCYSVLSESWKKTLRSTLFWYIESVNDYICLDSRIVLAQAALERISFEIFVVSEKTYTEKKFNSLKASDRLCEMFEFLSIPADVSLIRNLLKPEEIRNWTTSAEAITKVRNSIVHPKAGISDKSKLLYEVWRLSLWFLELTILAASGYNGVYGNRLVKQYYGDVEPVPWVVNSSAQRQA
ncbi:hypothetical protein [Lacunimicrobium album]